jgi:transposase
MTHDAKEKYLVDLSDEERQSLLRLLGSSNHSSRKLPRARILLQADEGFTDEQIARTLQVGRVTVERLRQRFIEGGLTALTDKPDPGQKPKLSAKAEARLIAEACSQAPEGRTHWTMQLLAERLVELQEVDTISDEAMRRTMKKLPQAVAQTTMVYPVSRCGFCRRDGRSPRPLCPAL